MEAQNIALAGDDHKEEPTTSFNFQDAEPELAKA